MLQLFNVSWSEVAQKMPELAEAGYNSLWLPPDTWELENFGNLDRDGSGDWDNDGLTDRKEYIVGSNPKDASSAFPLLTFEGNGGTFRIEFPTVAGRRYTVMGRNGLTDGTPWGDQDKVMRVAAGQANPVMGDGGVKAVTETGLGSTHSRFYRI